jgi:hypothetical protein
MAVSRMTPLASLVKLREGPHSLPLLFQGHPPFLSVPFSSKYHFLRLAEQALARVVLRYSLILIPKPLLSSFPTNKSLLYGQSASQRGSLVVLCRSPLLPMRRWRVWERISGLRLIINTSSTEKRGARVCSLTWGL